MAPLSAIRFALSKRHGGVSAPAAARELVNAAVADGRADVCACFVSEDAATDPARVLEEVTRVYAPAAWRLRVLSITDPIPSHGIVIGPGVSPEDAARYTEALVHLHEQASGSSALVSLMSATRLVTPPLRPSGPGGS